MKNKDIGIKISELRKAKGMTQEELAELCNISVRTLQRIEAGKVKPRSYTINSILVALGEENYFVTNSLKITDDTSVNSETTPQLKQKVNTKKKIAILAAIVLIVLIAGLGMIFLTNSNTDDYDLGNLQTSHIAVIDVEVESAPQNVRVVKLIEMGNENIFSEQGSFENGKLSIHLPEDMPSNFVYIILKKHTGVIRSDEKARFAFAKFEGFDENDIDNPIGRFEYRSDERKINTTFLYADRDVTLIGKDNSKDTWRTSLIKGWNMVFYEETDEGNVIMSSLHPGDEMKWRFRRYPCR